MQAGIDTVQAGRTTTRHSVNVWGIESYKACRKGKKRNRKNTEKTTHNNRAIYMQEPHGLECVHVHPGAVS